MAKDLVKRRCLAYKQTWDQLAPIPDLPFVSMRGIRVDVSRYELAQARAFVTQNVDYTVSNAGLHVHR